MGKKAGRNFKAYYDSNDQLITGPSLAGVTDWDELTLIGDVTWSGSRDRIEANTRANGDFKGYLTGLKDAELTLSLLYDDTDAAVTFLYNKWDDGTPLAFAEVDGVITTSGTKGIAGNWLVQNFEEGHPLDGAATVDVSLVAYDQTQRVNVS